MLGSKMDRLAINLRTDVHSIYYDKRQKLRIQHQGAPEEGAWRKKRHPVSLGVGVGGQEISVTLARQALALGCLMFYGRLWMPHCGHRHKAGTTQSLRSA